MTVKQDTSYITVDNLGFSVRWSMMIFPDGSWGIRIDRIGVVDAPRWHSVDITPVIQKGDYLYNSIVDKIKEGIS